MPGPKFFSPSTFTWPIIAAMPKSIFATKAFAFLPIEFNFFGAVLGVKVHRWPRGSGQDPGRCGHCSIAY